MGNKLCLVRKEKSFDTLEHLAPAEIPEEVIEKALPPIKTKSPSIVPKDGGKVEQSEEGLCDREGD